MTITSAARIQGAILGKMGKVLSAASGTSSNSLKPALATNV